MPALNAWTAKRQAKHEEKKKKDFNKKLATKVTVLMQNRKSFNLVLLVPEKFSPWSLCSVQNQNETFIIEGLPKKRM